VSIRGWSISPPARTSSATRGKRASCIGEPSIRGPSGLVAAALGDLLPIHLLWIAQVHPLQHPLSRDDLESVEQWSDADRDHIRYSR
jgi:hypothetical protein